MTETKKNKKHIPYTDTVKKLAASQWGREYESDNDAQRELLGSITLEGACMLGIVQRIDRVILSLTQDEIKLQAGRLHDSVTATIDAWVSEREAAHGKCPLVVVHHLWECAYRYIGKMVLLSKELYGYYYPSPPPRKTEARREYDKWMRSKGKVGEDVD